MTRNPGGHTQIRQLVELITQTDGKYKLKVRIPPITTRQTKRKVFLIYIKNTANKKV